MPSWLVHDSIVAVNWPLPASSLLQEVKDTIPTIDTSVTIDTRTFFIFIFFLGLIKGCAVEAATSCKTLISARQACGLRGFAALMTEGIAVFNAGLQCPHCGSQILFSCLCCHNINILVINKVNCLSIHAVLTARHSHSREALQSASFLSVAQRDVNNKTLIRKWSRPTSSLSSQQGLDSLYNRQER